MSVTTANLAMGPGNLYSKAFSVTAANEPFDSEVNGTPAASAWADAGGTLGGLRFVQTNAWKELEVDQLTETPERRRTKKEVSLATSLAEVTFTNLALAMAGGTIDTANLTYDTFEPATDNSGDAPTYKAVLFDGFGGAGLRRRVVIRKVLSTENVEVAASKEDQTVYPVTFTSHYVSSSVKSWRVINAK